MDSNCRQCGTPLAPGATFCGHCGAATTPTSASRSGIPVSATSRSPQPRTANSSTPIILGTLAVLVVATLGGIAYWIWSPSPAAPSAPVSAPVAAAPPEQVDTLAQLTEESERLARSQAEITQQMQQTIAKYQAQSGGQLPEGIASGLTPEQRALLAERIKTEKMSTASLLNDLLAKDQQLHDLSAQLEEMKGRLPESVTATDGQRHDRIAMDFLIRHGVNADQAYKLVSQQLLSETLIPGFRVWLFYQNGLFGTWVTQGTANTSPKSLRDRVAKIVEEERDAAIGALDAEKVAHSNTKADRDDLRNIAAASEKSLVETQEELKTMLAAAERQQAMNSTLRYIVGSKREMQRAKIIDGSLRMLRSELSGSTVAAADGATLPPIDPAQYGLKKINKVTVVPGTVEQGTDYKATIVDGFLTLSITNPERFSQYAKFFVVVLE